MQGNIPSQKPKKAVIYTRVSTDEQAKEGMSLEAQKLACIEYCKRNQIEVVKTFVEEGESAKTANRAQLRELLKYCREHKNDIDVVVVHKLDRFARNAADHLQMRNVLVSIPGHRDQ